MIYIKYPHIWCYCSCQTLRHSQIYWNFVWKYFAMSRHLYISYLIKVNVSVLEHVDIIWHSHTIVLQFLKIVVILKPGNLSYHNYPKDIGQRWHNYLFKIIFLVRNIPWIYWGSLRAYSNKHSKYDVFIQSYGCKYILLKYKCSIFH